MSSEEFKARLDELKRLLNEIAVYRLEMPEPIQNYLKRRELELQTEELSVEEPKKKK